VAKFFQIMKNKNALAQVEALSAAALAHLRAPGASARSVAAELTAGNATISPGASSSAGAAAKASVLASALRAALRAVRDSPAEWAVLLDTAAVLGADGRVPRATAASMVEDLVAATPVGGCAAVLDFVGKRVAEDGTRGPFFFFFFFFFFFLGVFFFFFFFFF
jgi:hypothetical protein